MESVLKDAALAYAAKGWRVIPCYGVNDGTCGCGNPTCKSPGKHPLIGSWPKNATTDPEQVREWWSRWRNANIGVATGEGSGVFVLDLDGPAAVDELQRLEALHGELPRTVTARTGKGFHYYFRFDPDRPLRNRTKIGGVTMDVRTEGGYVITPPSAHASGTRYEWVNTPDRVEVAAAPGWLLDYLTGGGDQTVSRNTLPSQPSEGDDLDLESAPGVSEGGRHDAATRLIGKALARGTDPVEVLDLAYTWAERCDPPFDREAVKRMVKDFAAKDAAKLAPDTPDRKEPWPTMGGEAFHGLAGDFVRRVEPQTEADPNALLVQVLVVAGTAFGRNPHYRVEATDHNTNLFAVVVGDTGDGRKGTGFGRVRAVFPLDAQTRIAHGLSSGEGLIHHVRDPLYKKEATKKKGVVVDEKEVLVDEGVTDKRVLVYESEFQSVLAHMRRDTNILSNVLRQAWENGNLSTMTKHSPTKATAAHVGIIGNVTKEELVASLTAVDSANGFANRFLWVMSRQSKLLPFGGSPEGLADLQGPLTAAIAFAGSAGLVEFDADARGLWEQLYRGDLSRPRSGLFGKATSRAAPQTIRLAMVYALLDRSNVIRVEHLRAGAAVWRYCEQSARYIFGDRTGDPAADKILNAARRGPVKRKEVHKLFNNHLSAASIDAAVGRLVEQGLVRREWEQTGGRPSEVIVAV